MLLATAAALGFLHTVMGPDHYVPFAAMAKAHGWSRLKTLGVTTACGLGHVGSSIAIAAVLAGGGVAVAQWTGSSWEAWHESRGDLAAWLLIGVGAALTVYGLVQGSRGQVHTHPHVHGDGTVHTHPHDHQAEHAHLHAPQPEATLLQQATPWVLFLIFVFGPCESLIPLMLVAGSEHGLLASALVALAFSLTTLVAIVGATLVLTTGLERLPLPNLERWSTAVAGGSLALCGAGIAFLGL